MADSDDSRQLRPEVEEDAPETRDSDGNDRSLTKRVTDDPYDPAWREIVVSFGYHPANKDKYEIYAKPYSNHVFSKSEEFFKKFDEIHENFGTLDLLMAYDLLQWNSKKRLDARRMVLKRSLHNLAEFLALVDVENLRSIHVEPGILQTEIFDLPAIQKPKHVVVFGGVCCPDDKLMQMDAERFINNPTKWSHPFLYRGYIRERIYTFRGVVRSVFRYLREWIYGPEPKKCNSPIVINQYIKKCLLNLDTKNQRFWLWPHDNYDIQTIFSGLEVTSLGPYEYGTAHSIDSNHPEFVFMVFLLEFGVFGRRMARGSEIPTPDQLLDIQPETY